jgi:hypothetical protein
VLKLIVQAALMEGVLTEKVNSRQSQAALTQTALHHLKDLGTEWAGRREEGERERERERD